MNLHRIFTALSALLMICTATAQQRVACIGNSITYGYTVENREVNAYPFQLQRMLGEGYTVGNFGHSGATLMRHGHRPYFNLQEFRDAISFKPDIALIHLGINDTDPRNWPQLGREFAGDYMALIDSLRKVNPQVRIIVANLSPITSSHWRFRSGTRIWREKIRHTIADVARAADVELIDFETPLRYHPNLIPDALHPTAAGATRMARYAYGAITGNFGGLKMPEVYQSGMVLQRNQQLTFVGQANAGSKITLTLNNINYHATTNNVGEWQIITAPLATGGPYTLQITDGHDTLTFTDILAGEVWIAAGQSNMAFTMNEAINSRPDIESCADPMLRILDKQPVVFTNSGRWTDEVIARIDSLDHYLPAKWEAISPENIGRFSAVAYYFADSLRTAMPNVPIGIISAAVGGSTMDSWTDLAFIEEHISESLLNWRKNDYHQKWVKDRADENVGDGHRHPYDPGYLFSAAIRPLGPLNIAGAIWYQGESNDQNTELFEQMYHYFINSWRKHFRNPSLPIYSVQLSGIERAAWPQIRDCQRRLADSIPATAMVVSSDHGDRYNVHPVNKLPVGRRLARQALYRLYGHRDVTPQGPTPRSVKAINGTIEITLDWADGLRTSDGEAPRTFEIAEIDGLYQPADVQFIDNKIILKNMTLKNPRFVRYAWQPFTLANVVNSDALPMSTFFAEVDNAADFDLEDGMQYGVSAPYAGRLGKLLIMAGGCNFPTADPFAPGATKKFYKGIYAADPATMQWARIGSLPEAAGYGATVALGDDALLLIGGTSANAALTSVMRLTITDGRVSLETLTPLPAAIDNMAAAAIGSRVYVAGGNVNGKPSGDLYMLDLNSDKQEWKKLKSIPGNPRTQPAMAAGKDANGEMSLFLFGGFAPRHDGNEPTLEVDGVKYTPSKNKWTSLDAPVDADGTPVGLGGGIAATLSDGRLAFAGGVNKDVFLDALTDQKPDYLEHPVGWYRFNPNIFTFNPATLTWNIELTSPDAARAGAAMIAGSDADLFLIGGELKPRIRSSETLHLK